MLFLQGFRTKMRMCGLTGKLSCDECHSESILQIDMLGVLLRICNSNLYICAACTRISIWQGNGCNLTACTCQSTTRQSVVNKTCCSVCNSRYIVMPQLLYPDMARERIARVFLCGKHVLPGHVMNFIHDYSAFQLAIRTNKKKQKIRV